jgi:hypothetical protein
MRKEKSVKMSQANLREDKRIRRKKKSFAGKKSFVVNGAKNSFQLPSRTRHEIK